MPRRNKGKSPGHLLATSLGPPRTARRDEEDFTRDAAVDDDEELSDSDLTFGRLYLGEALAGRRTMSRDFMLKSSCWKAGWRQRALIKAVATQHTSAPPGNTDPFGLHPPTPYNGQARVSASYASRSV